MDNFSEISLSFDGPEDIQNYNRPLVGGKGSFARVLETIKRLDERSFPYGIRTTVTNMSAGYMDKIVDFLGRTCKTKRIHFEPVFSCGRCNYTKIDSPSANDFIEGFRKAQEVADNCGISLFYSVSRLDTITIRFCRVSDDSFCVTQDGDVTSCYEVCSKDDPRSKTFFMKNMKRTRRNLFFGRIN